MGVLCGSGYSIGSVRLSSYPARTLQNAWRVDINNATLDELQLLPRVGPSLAARINAHRQESPFSSLDELEQIRGIGVLTLSRIRPHATVGVPRP
jgi:competence ComEA-like helix-hairpin-helix protein